MVGKTKGNITNHGHLFAGMMAHWVHEDVQYWTQFRYLVVTQTAAVAAWFGLGPSILSVFAMLFAAAFAWKLKRLAEIIRTNRNVNEKAIYALANDLVATDFIADYGHPEHDRTDIFRFSKHDLDTVSDAGRKFQGTWFNIAIGANLAVAGVSLMNLYHPVLGWLHPRLGPSQIETSAPSLYVPREQACPVFIERCELGGPAHLWTVP